MCKHGFDFIHEMHYSSIAYFQGVMAGKDVKFEVSLGKKQDLSLCILIAAKVSELPNYA